MDKTNCLNQLMLSEISRGVTNYGKLNVAIDVSGPVNIENMKLLVREIVDEIKKPASIIFSDSSVIKEVDYSEFNETLFILGKNIADFSETFLHVNEKLNDEGCCGLIYITDGHGFLPEAEPQYPVIWILTGGSPSEDIPFGLKFVLS